MPIFPLVVRDFLAFTYQTDKEKRFFIDSLKTYLPGEYKSYICSRV